MSQNVIRVNQRKFKKNVRRAKSILERKLPRETLKEAKRNTPVESGNARQNTKLKKYSGSAGFEIISDYPYGKVIDEGLYGKPPGSANGPKTTNGYSNQARQGIFEPTEKFIRKFLRRYFRRF